MVITIFCIDNCRLIEKHSTATILRPTHRHNELKMSTFNVIVSRIVANLKNLPQNVVVLFYCSTYCERMKCNSSDNLYTLRKIKLAKSK